MTDASVAPWRERRGRIAWLAGLVLAVEMAGLFAGIPAALMNLARLAEVRLGLAWGIGSPASYRRWSISLGSLTLMEVALLGAGAYVPLVWVIRLFVYPFAILLTTPPGGEVRFAWVWAGVVGVMLVAFGLEKAGATGSAALVWLARGAAGGAGVLAVLFVGRVWKALISLKFAVVVLSLLALLSMLGTLVVQRPPVSPSEYPEKFAAGQVGFLVNGEVLLGMESVPEAAKFSAEDRAHAAALREAFGPEIARQYEKRESRAGKNAYVGAETNRRIRAHGGEVRRLMGFLDGLFFTSMFKSWAFNSLLILTCLSLLAVVASKWPWGRYGWGAPVTHVGIVLVLVACAISDLSLKHGYVEMMPDGPSSVARGFLDRQGQFEGTFAKGELDAAMERIRDRLGGPGIVEFEGPKEQAGAEIREGEESWRVVHDGHVAAEGAAARDAVKGWERVKYTATPWVEFPFLLAMEDGHVEYYHELLVGVPDPEMPGQAMEEGFPLRAGKEISLYGGRYTARILEFYPHARVGGGAAAMPRGELVFTLPEGEATVERRIPATLGEHAFDTGRGGYDVEVLAVAGNYALHERKVALADQDWSNPAVRVRVKDPAGEVQTVWVFSNFPQFYSEGAMGARNDKVAVAGILFSISAPAAGPEGALEDKDVEPVPLGPDDIPGPSIVPVAKVEFTEPGPGGSGVRTTTRWLRLAEKNVMSRFGPQRQTRVPPGDPKGWIVSGDGKVRIRVLETAQQSVYETHVAILTKEGQPVAHDVIRVNGALLHRGFRFYQSNFDDSGRLPLTGLTVKYDPAIPLLYTGFLVTMAGLVFAFYVLPPLRRRAEARKRAEFSGQVRMKMEF